MNDCDIMHAICVTSPMSSKMTKGQIIKDKIKDNTKEKENLKQTLHLKYDLITVTITTMQHIQPIWPFETKILLLRRALCLAVNC